MGPAGIELAFMGEGTHIAARHATHTAVGVDLYFLHKALPVFLFLSERRIPKIPRGKNMTHTTENSPWNHDPGVGQGVRQECLKEMKLGEFSP